MSDRALVQALAADGPNPLLADKGSIVPERATVATGGWPA